MQCPATLISFISTLQNQETRQKEVPLQELSPNLKCIFSEGMPIRVFIVMLSATLCPSISIKEQQVTFEMQAYNRMKNWKGNFGFLV